MTTLYKPVLIESAEQAEALPIGTLAILPDGLCHRQILTKTNNGPGPWEVDMHGYPHVALIGWTALVPIEAEEVHVTARGLLELDMHGRPDVNHDVADARPYRRTEYRTPWEEA